MKRTTFATGLIVVVFAIAAAAFGGFASAASQKAVSSPAPFSVAVHNTTAASGATLSKFMTALQAKVKDPLNASPAQIRTAATQVGNQQGLKVKVTISCSYPPFSCTITVSF
jgi:uncharacterized protein YfcZ (UPF0381/DUF406 family)